MKKTFLFILVLVVLILGAFFRLEHLNNDSLWLDEGVTYYNSSADDLSGVWDKATRLDQSPPGYYFITHYYLEVFGENEFGFRMIPLIIGVLVIFFTYLLAAEMFDKETGVFASILIAVNEFHIGFSMESRMYGLLALLALIGLFSLHKALQHEERGYEWWAVFTLSSIAGIYSHNFYAFVLLAFAVIFLLYILTVKKKVGKILLGGLSALLVVIAYLPWLPSFLRQMSVERYWLPENNWSDLMKYVLSYAAENHLLLWSFIALSVLGGIWAVVNVKSENYKKNLLSIFAVVIFLVISLGTPLLYSIKVEPILKIRYTVYIVPLFMIAVAYGLKALKKMSIVFPVFILALMVYFSMPMDASAYPVEFGEDFRGLVEEVKKDSAPVVVHTPSIAHVINFYNKGSFEVWPFPFSDDLTEFSVTEASETKYKDLIRRFDSFYLVVTHTHEAPHGLLRIWGEAECDEMEELQIEGMEVFHFSACK